MKEFRNAVTSIDRLPARLGCFGVLLALLVPGGAAQDRSEAAANSKGLSQASGSSSGNPKFTDITSVVNINFDYVASHTSKKYLIETMGSGVALFDYDNDGRLDIFAVNGAPLSDPTTKGTIPQKTSVEHWNRLFHQKPDGTFEDVTEKAGLRGVG